MSRCPPVVQPAAARVARGLVVSAVAVAAVVFGFGLAIAPIAAHRASAQSVSDPPRLRPPVPGPIVDHFREPSSPYGPGNRGLDYAPGPGTLVRAAVAGSVEFAGAVAGEQWVTITHDDGYRTSYGPLASIAVSLHESLVSGDVVGRSGEALHFGLRLGATYLDPEPWFAAASPGRAVLVALDP
jgi:murein DD-endopeptidase MepM/ murein hydrolase activator NlpD